MNDFYENVSPEDMREYIEGLEADAYLSTIEAHDINNYWYD